MLARSPLAADRSEATSRWTMCPAAVRSQARDFFSGPNFASRQWPPAVVAAAEAFLEAEAQVGNENRFPESEPGNAILTPDICR